MSHPLEIYKMQANVAGQAEDFGEASSQHTKKPSKVKTISGPGQARAGITPWNQALRNSETNNYNFVTNNYIINNKKTEDYSIYSEIKPIVGLPSELRSKPRKKRRAMNKLKNPKLKKTRKSNRLKQAPASLRKPPLKTALGNERRPDARAPDAKQAEPGRMSWKDQIKKLDEDEEEEGLLDDENEYLFGDQKNLDRLREKRIRIMSNSSEKLIKSYKVPRADMIDLYSTNGKKRPLERKGGNDVERMFKTGNSFYPKRTVPRDNRQIDFMDIYKLNKKKIRQKKLLNKQNSSTQSKHSLRKNRDKPAEFNFANSNYMSLKSKLSKKSLRSPKLLQKNYRSQNKIRLDFGEDHSADLDLFSELRPKRSLLETKSSRVFDLHKNFSSIVKKPSRKKLLRMNKARTEAQVGKNTLSLSNLTDQKRSNYDSQRSRYQKMIEKNIYDYNMTEHSKANKKKGSSLTSKKIFTAKSKQFGKGERRERRERGERVERVERVEKGEKGSPSMRRVNRETLLGGPGKFKAGSGRGELGPGKTASTLRKESSLQRKLLLKVKSETKTDSPDALDLVFLDEHFRKKPNKRSLKRKGIMKKNAQNQQKQQRTRAENKPTKETRLGPKAESGRRGTDEKGPEEGTRKKPNQKSTQKRIKKKKFELNLNEKGKYNLTQGFADSSDEVGEAPVTFYDPKKRRKKKTRNMFIDLFAKQLEIEDFEKNFLKRKMEKQAGGNAVIKEIYNGKKKRGHMRQKAQKKQKQSRNFDFDPVHHAEKPGHQKKKSNLMTNSFCGPSGNKIGALISDSKEMNLVKGDSRDVIGSLLSRKNPAKKKDAPARKSDPERTKAAKMRTVPSKKRVASRLKKSVSNVKLTRPKLRASKTKGQLEPANNIGNLKSLNTNNATIFHYEFNLNTFNNFMNSLKMMGFKEFDLEEYGQGISTTSIKNYMDSPFPTKALHKQNSLVNLNKTRSNKNLFGGGLFASPKQSLQIQSKRDSLTGRNKVPKGLFKATSFHQSIPEKNKILSQKDMQEQIKLNIKKSTTTNDKLKRNMSSNQLPTSLEPIPEQGLYPVTRDIPLQLKKVALMNKSIKGFHRNWFASLKTFDVHEFKDPQLDRYLILDLDETLIHCSTKAINKDARQISLFGRVIYIHLRPYVRAFLRELRKYFNLIIYTASKQSYADKVLSFLDPDNKLFCLRLYRTSCQRVINNHVLKSMGVLRGLDPGKTLIIDNSLICFFFDLDNVIPILSYFGSVQDQELYRLCTFIIELLDQEKKDFRPRLKKVFNLEMLKTGMDKKLILHKILSK